MWRGSTTAATRTPLEPSGACSSRSSNESAAGSKAATAGAYRSVMTSSSVEPPKRDSRELIGFEPVTRENLHQRIAAMLDRVEAMDDPWAAGAAMGILGRMRDDGLLSDEDFVLYEAEHTVRIGKGWRWLDELKAAIDKLGST